jgi:hypothetical protein
MRAFVLTLAILLPQLVLANDFAIEHYQFEWTVAEIGNVELSVVKTDESSYIRLYSDQGLSSFLRLTGDEAETISEALGKTNEFYEKQKGAAQDVAEVASAGEYKVTFRTSVKYGFSVVIRKSSGFSMDSFRLDRSEALDLQKYLKNSRAMLDYVETRVDP